MRNAVTPLSKMLGSQHPRHEWELVVGASDIMVSLILAAILREGETQRLRNLSKVMQVPT